jgi:hypothetical protein
MLPCVDSTVDAAQRQRGNVCTLARSIIDPTSLGHSKSVIRRFLPLTIVMGPLVSFRLCLVRDLTRDLIRVLLPQPGGP